MNDQERTRLRREELGFVYQFHHLLPEFSALENVVIPQLIRGLSKTEAPSRYAASDVFLGLGKRLDHFALVVSQEASSSALPSRAVANAPAAPGRRTDGQS